MNVPHISRTTKIVLIGEFILLSYMLYVLSTSLYKSYQVDRFIQQAEQDNVKLAQENASLSDDYDYYRSNAYREKIAKQNFGLVRPGEEVIVLAPDGTKFLTPQEKVLQANEQYYYSLSNPRKWFMFFFDREKFSS